MLTKDGSTAQDLASRQELASRLKAHDSDAWNMVTREHHAPLTRYLTLFCPDAPEDAAQTTWLRAFNGIQSYNPEFGEFRNWLFGIGHNVCLDAIRKEARRRTVNVEPSQIDQFPSGNAAPAAGLESALAGCISHLGTDERHIVGAKAFGWSTDRDLARRLQIEIGNLYTIRFRALAKLAKCLAKKGYDHVTG